MRYDDKQSDAAILSELGQRLSATRLALRTTQDDLATAAGVSKRTIERLENGHSSQLIMLIRCLRALGRLEALDALVPEARANPLEQLTRDRPQRIRRRVPASASRPTAPWRWGDEG
ncbi:MAG: helix-turn-helix domain-containing protein [Devosia sp.]